MPARLPEALAARAPALDALASALVASGGVELRDPRWRSIDVIAVTNALLGRALVARDSGDVEAADRAVLAAWTLEASFDGTCWRLETLAVIRQVTPRDAAWDERLRPAHPRQQQLDAIDRLTTDIEIEVAHRPPLALPWWDRHAVRSTWWKVGPLWQWGGAAQLQQLAELRRAVDASAECDEEAWRAFVDRRMNGYWQSLNWRLAQARVGDVSELHRALTRRVLATAAGRPAPSGTCLDARLVSREEGGDVVVYWVMSPGVLLGIDSFTWARER